jgi:hypothetical protein
LFFKLLIGFLGLAIAFSGSREVLLNTLSINASGDAVSFVAALFVLVNCHAKNSLVMKEGAHSANYSAEGKLYLKKSVFLILNHFSKVCPI